jgi:hypothetical protein
VHRFLTGITTRPGTARDHGTGNPGTGDTISPGNDNGDTGSGNACPGALENLHLRRFR